MSSENLRQMRITARVCCFVRKVENHTRAAPSACASISLLCLQIVPPLLSSHVAISFERWGKWRNWRHLTENRLGRRSYHRIGLENELGDHSRIVKSWRTHW